MIDMFENYPQSDDYIPDNRPKWCKPERIEIVVGETTKHSFTVPFSIEGYVDYQIIYKVGVDLVLIKRKEDIIVNIKEDGSTELSCIITPFETKSFNSIILNTVVQLKFANEYGEISYSDKYKVMIKDAVDADPSPYVPPVPIVIGFGYTED